MIPGQENLEIQYTGLSWSRPQAIKFRFRLVGLDRDWVDAGARRTAYYSHLPPGSYTFNGDRRQWRRGVERDRKDTRDRGAAALLPDLVVPRRRSRSEGWSDGVALLALSHRPDAAAQSAQQAFSRQLIESQERERQRIAAELHDSLGQNLLVVKNRALLGAHVATGRGGAQAVHRDRGDDGADAGGSAHHLLQSAAAPSRSARAHDGDSRDDRDDRPRAPRYVISSELDDIDGVFPPADEITIYRIIQESLNNVVKHSRAGEARVAVRCHEHQVEIAIRDNGQGFASSASNGRTGPSRWLRPEGDRRTRADAGRDTHD